MTDSSVGNFFINSMKVIYLTTFRWLNYLTNSTLCQGIVPKIYNTRPPLVEHAMRNAIEIAWSRGNQDTIRAYFGYTANDHKGKPSNLEFVATMAQRALTYVKK